jgi:glycosyltransferase involved in cell wall biosynthesis
VAPKLGFLERIQPIISSKVTLVFPAHNEAGNLKRAIEETEGFLLKIRQDFEIIIAEDGSTDGTDDIARGIADSNRRVRWIHHDERLGRGRALSGAFRESEGSILIYLDVDLSTDIRFLEPLIETIIDGYDIAIGSRAHPRSRVRRSLGRTITSLVYNSLVRFILGSNLKDHQCGFKAFKRNSLFDIINEIYDEHWFWDTELLVLASRNGLKVKEVPIVWRESNKSTVILFKDVINMAFNIIKLWWRIKIIKPS